MSRLVGRPPVEPSGAVSQVVEYAAWLKQLMQELPRIRYADVASELTKRRPTKVHTSAITRELDGTNIPSEDLVDVIMELRELDGEHHAGRSSFLSTGATLREIALAAESRAKGGRHALRLPIGSTSPPPRILGPGLGGASGRTPGTAPASHAAPRQAAEQRNQNAEQEIARLRAEIDRVKQDAARRVSGFSRESEKLRSEVESLTVINAELTAETSAQKVEIMGLRVELQAAQEQSGPLLADLARMEREQLAELEAVKRQRHAALEDQSSMEKLSALLKEEIRAARHEFESLTEQISTLSHQRANALNELERIQSSLDAQAMIESQPVESLDAGHAEAMPLDAEMPIYDRMMEQIGANGTSPGRGRRRKEKSADAKPSHSGGQADPDTSVQLIAASDSSPSPGLAPAT